MQPLIVNPRICKEAQKSGEWRPIFCSLCSQKLTRSQCENWAYEEDAGRNINDFHPRHPDER